MKILFLHMSDMHIEKKNDIYVKNVPKIIEALNSFGSIDKIIIIISGDIAYSGLRIQYDSAWNLLGTIICLIKKKFGVEKVDVLIVPGNHDIDYSKGDLKHQGIQDLFRSGNIEAEIHNELKKQYDYLNFAKGNYCLDKTQPLFIRKEINCNGFRIEANLINSAIFSSLDEDKGLHYLPAELIDKFSESSQSDFTITIMHHSHHWLNDCVKNSFEEVLIKKNNLVFYGHEHNIGTYTADKDGYKVVFFAGGEL